MKRVSLFCDDIEFIRKIQQINDNITRFRSLRTDNFKFLSQSKPEIGYELNLADIGELLRQLIQFIDSKDGNNVIQILGNLKFQLDKLDILQTAAISLIIESNILTKLQDCIQIEDLNVFESALQFYQAITRYSTQLTHLIFINGTIEELFQIFSSIKLSYSNYLCVLHIFSNVCFDVPEARSYLFGNNIISLLCKTLISIDDNSIIESILLLVNTILMDDEVVSNEDISSIIIQHLISASIRFCDLNSQDPISSEYILFLVLTMISKLAIKPSNTSMIISSNFLAILFEIFPSMYGRTYDEFLYILEMLIRLDSSHMIINQMRESFDFEVLIKSESKSIFSLLNEILVFDQGLAEHLLSIGILPILRNAIEEGDFHEKLSSAQTLSIIVQNGDENLVEYVIENEEVIETLLDFSNCELPVGNLEYIMMALERIKQSPNFNEGLQSLYENYDFDAISTEVHERIANCEEEDVS